MNQANILEKQFTERLLEAAKIAKTECNYNPSVFLKMLSDYGGIGTARRLIAAKTISDGFEKLWRLKRLDLTVEAIVLEAKWKSIFSDAELEIAKDRLKKARYEFPDSDFHESGREEEHNDRKPWTKEELEATVDAYILMLDKETRVQPYNKAEINRELRSGALKNRNKSSVEFRMQNISAVMEGLCLQRIKGYLPAKNIGANVFNEIKTILSEKGYIDSKKYEPTEDQNEYDRRASELIKSLQLGKPIGIETPEKVIQNTSVYKRDPLVKAWILTNANGKCEKCDSKGPFIKDNGTIYLEIHHLKSLSDRGSDKIENAIALCPNCHREMHYSKNRLELIVEIKNRIPRFSKET